MRTISSTRIVELLFVKHVTEARDVLTLLRRRGYLGVAGKYENDQRDLEARNLEHITAEDALEARRHLDKMHTAMTTAATAA